MNVEFKTGETITLNHKGKKRKGVVRGVQLSIHDTFGSDFIVVKCGKKVIEVEFTDVSLDGEQT